MENISVWLNFRVLCLTCCHKLDAATLIMLSHGGQRCACVIAHASALIFIWPSDSNVNFAIGLRTLVNPILRILINIE
jgi:hypothetical protein